MTTFGTIIIRADVLPGAHISRAARDLQGLSDHLDREVSTTFNGTTITAKPGGTAAEIETAWHSRGETK